MALTPLHPETTEDPTTIRWVIPVGTLKVRGPVISVPGTLQDWLDDGRIVAAVVDPEAVMLTLAVDRSWSADGPAVRSALHVALAEPSDWVTERPTGALRADAEALIDGVVGQVAASHGGEIELVDVLDDVVTVRMHGACNGCPAASVTLHQRLEDELRRLHPSLREVRSLPGSRPRRPALLRIGRRPGL